MGKRRRRAKQPSMWVATNDLPRSAAHPFYTRLNQLLEQHDFDGYVEGLCERFYAEDGRPGLPPVDIFGCCSSGISKAWTRNARLRGGRLIRLRCANFSAWCCRRRRPTIRRFPARAACLISRPTRRSSPGCCSDSPTRVWSRARPSASMRRRGRRMRRCAASCGATGARPITTS